MAMNETCNSPHGDFGRSTACNEDKSIYRVSIPIGTKCCPFVMKQPWYNQPNTRELTNHPGKSAISRTQNWFLLLADWAFSGGCGQVPLVSGRPCYKPIGGKTSTPVWLTTLSTFLWGITRLIGESDWVVYIEKFILSTWLYSFLYWGHLLIRIYMGHKYIHVFCSYRKFIHIPISQISLSPIFKSYEFQVWGRKLITSRNQ